MGTVCHWLSVAPNVVDPGHASIELQLVVKLQLHGVAWNKLTISLACEMPRHFYFFF